MAVPGQTAIVTGASSGIGRATALALAAEGFQLLLVARSIDKLKVLKTEIEKAGGVASVVQADVTVEEQVEALFAACVEIFGPPNVLINNAGIADHTPTRDLTTERWLEVMNINLNSVFLCSRAALQLMEAAGGGRIINVGSLSASMPHPDTVAYAASKFGLEGLTRAMALDGRVHGIAVSIIHPGSTVTSLIPGLTDKPRPGAMAAEDVARVIALMATLPPDVNFLEGTILPVSQPFLGRG